MSALFPRLVAACLLVVGLVLPAADAAADPLRLSPPTQSTAPEKPSLTIAAEESVTNFMLALEPGPGNSEKAAETAPQTFKQKKLAAGQKVVFRLGTGKVGSTAWKGIIQCQDAGGKLWKREINLTTTVAPKLDISFDPNFHSSHLNIEQHWVEVQLSAPAGRGQIQVFADDGSDMGGGEATFHGEAPGTWLRLPWQGKMPKTADSVVLRLAITLFDTDGNQISIDLYPWFISVPHEEVNFALGSWEIAENERSKLDESLRKINAVLDRVDATLRSFSERGILTNPPMPKLFVGGHTDTVGGDSENLTLSKNRARAIAGYFRQRGFRFPIFFVGYGERQLRAKTADNVDEPRNRRADYTLALDSPPLIPGIAWQKL